MNPIPHASPTSFQRRDFITGAVALGAATLIPPAAGQLPSTAVLGPILGRSGATLMGGDIHASRVLRYKTEKVVGYELVQFIASPIHSSTIPSLNVYNPDLVRSAVEPNVFLRIDADSTVTPAEFHATLINKDGETVFSYHLTEDELKSLS